MDILNKILFLVFTLSILNTIRNIYYLVQASIKKERFGLTKKELFLLGLSIAFITTCIFTGITI